MPRNCRGARPQVRLAPSRAASRLFFFQAEDGIRDRTVTGVQTCALPIWIARLEGRDGAPSARGEGLAGFCGRETVLGKFRRRIRRDHVDRPGDAPVALLLDEIGRASCREGV